VPNGAIVRNQKGKGLRKFKWVQGKTVLKKKCEEKGRRESILEGEKGNLEKGADQGRRDSRESGEKEKSYPEISRSW